MNNKTMIGKLSISARGIVRLRLEIVMVVELFRTKTYITILSRSMRITVAVQRKIIL